MGLPVSTAHGKCCKGTLRMRYSALVLPIESFTIGDGSLHSTACTAIEGLRVQRLAMWKGMLSLVILVALHTLGQPFACNSHQ